MSTISILNSDSGLTGKTVDLLETDQTLTGLKTFSRGAAVPFAVAVGSLKVTNLNADKVDGYDLPASDGSSGQVLSTDGAGTLSWATTSSVIESQVFS